MDDFTFPKPTKEWESLVYGQPGVGGVPVHASAAVPDGAMYLTNGTLFVSDAGSWTPVGPANVEADIKVAHDQLGQQGGYVKAALDAFKEGPTSQQFGSVAHYPEYVTDVPVLGHAGPATVKVKGHSWPADWDPAPYYGFDAAAAPEVVTLWQPPVRAQDLPDPGAVAERWTCETCGVNWVERPTSPSWRGCPDCGVVPLEESIVAAMGKVGAAMKSSMKASTDGWASAVSKATESFKALGESITKAASAVHPLVKTANGLPPTAAELVASNVKSADGAPLTPGLFAEALDVIEKGWLPPSPEELLETAEIEAIVQWEE